jgi:hypothetical protein
MLPCLYCSRRLLHHAPMRTPQCSSRCAGMRRSCATNCSSSSSRHHAHVHCSVQQTVSKDCKPKH